MRFSTLVDRRWLWLAAFSLFAALAVPITVSFDGILYLQSSRYIFRDFALDGYQWTREPLYAVILQAIRITGGTAAIWVVAVQTVAAALAAWIVTGAVLGTSRLRWLALALVLFNPLTLGYAGSVLQSTWITLILALNTGLIWLATSRRASPRRLAVLTVLVMVLAVYLLAPLGYVSVITAGVVTWVSLGNASETDDPSRSERHAKLRRMLVVVLAILAMLALTRVALIPWNSYKDSVLQGAESNAAGIPTSIPAPDALDLLSGLPDRLPDVIETGSVILDIPLPEAVSTWGGDENDFFGFQPFSPVRRCGVLQVNEAIPAASNDAVALLSPTCVSKPLQAGVNLFVPAGRTLHNVASYAFVLGLLGLFWAAGRRALLLLLPFYGYFAMYSVYGASLDRYGFPVYVASATMLVFLLGQAASSARRLASRTRSREPQVASAEVGTSPVDDTLATPADRPRPRWTSVYVVSLVLVFIASTAVPFLITFDGYFYLSGSVALFTPDAADAFWWLREPGYSMFLRAIRSALGPSDRVVTLIQSILMLTGGVLAVFATWRARRPAASPHPWVVAVALVLGVGNAAVLLYSSAIMQQALFVFLLGAAVFVAVGAPTVPRILSALGLLGAAALLQEEYARLLVVPLTLGLFLVSMSRQREKSSEATRRTWRIPARAFLVAGVSFVSLQVVISLFMVPWGQYRTDQLALQSNTTSVAQFDDFPSLSAQLKSALGTQEPHPYSVASHLTALLGFTGSTQFASKPVERKVYIEARSNPAWSCGALEGLGPPNTKAAAYADEALDVSCRSSKAVTFWSKYISLSTAIYPYLLAAGVLAALASFLRGRQVVPSGTLLAFVAAYSLLGFGADRYSVAFFPLAIALLVSSVVDIGAWLQQRRVAGGTPPSPVGDTQAPEPDDSLAGSATAR